MSYYFLGQQKNKYQTYLFVDGAELIRIKTTQYCC